MVVEGAFDSQQHAPMTEPLVGLLAACLPPAEAAVSGDELVVEGAFDSQEHAPMTTLFALERIIQQRRAAMEANTGAL